MQNFVMISSLQFGWAQNEFSTQPRKWKTGREMESLGPLLLTLFDDLVQDCSNSSALAMELLQSCTRPSFWDSTEIRAWTRNYIP